MDNNNQPYSDQPKNTGFVPLATAIPEYRQQKLAGQRRIGPIVNIAPRWGNLNQRAENTVTTGSPSTTLQPKSVTLELQQSPIKSEIEQLQAKLIDKEQRLAESASRTTGFRKDYENLVHEFKAAESVIKNMKQQLTNMGQNPGNTDQIKKMQDQILAKEKENLHKTMELEELKKQLAGEQPLKEQVEIYKQQIQGLIAEQNHLHQTIIEQNQRAQSINQQSNIVDGHEPSTKYQSMLEKIIQTPQSQPTSPQKKQRKVVQAKTIQVGKNIPLLTQDKNSITGVVRDSTGKLIDGAVVIIKDKADHNLRALKTNPLGQFVATTPLPDGEYFIDVQNRELVFDIVSIYLTGTVIPPLDIVSNELLT